MKKRVKLPLVAAPVFPPMQCDKGCGQCCGPVPVTQAELDAARRYVLDHQVLPVQQGYRCPFYQRSQCAIYPARPRVCQAYGHSDEMLCPRGYNTPVEDEVALRRWVIGDAKRAPVVGYLHELAGIRIDPTELITQGLRALGVLSP